MTLYTRSISLVLIQIVLLTGIVYCEDNVNPDPLAITYDIIKSFEVGSEQMPKGMPGEIISSEPIQKDNYNWWQVRYADGTVGWSIENGLDSASVNTENGQVAETSGNKFKPGETIETNRKLNVRSDAGVDSAKETPNPYAGYNNYDAGIVSYGIIQFIAQGGTDSPLYRLLERYTALSQSETSKQLKTYVDGAKDGTKPWGESLRTDDTFHDLLMKASSEEAMQTSQFELFQKDYYDDAKAKATDDGMISALSVAIYSDTAVNRGQGKLNTLRTKTKEYFDDIKKEDPTAEPPTEQEWLKKFLDMRDEDAETTTYYSSLLSRIDALRKLVNDGNLDLTQGDSNNEIELGQHGKVATIDAPSRLQEAAGVSGSQEDDAGEGKTSLAALMLQIGSPLLVPEITWFSDQSKEGSEEQDQSGVSYFDQANDVWYIDAYSWSGDKSLYDKPAAPLHFISGELNTYGYNWVFLPYSQTGISYTQGYLDWVTETLASMGQSAPSAGYGLLIDDSQNGGGGW